jgi:hypothetical protein
MIENLSNERVNREGYMNMNCGWAPGCVDGLRMDTLYLDRQKDQEKQAVGKVWSNFFPSTPLPKIIRNACCAQFAASREIIHATPRASFAHYRDWLLTTDLEDEISGRVFEQLWHIIFTGRAELCPNQVGCYCDGYGICFDNDEELDEWFHIRFLRKEAEGELNIWKAKALAIIAADEAGDTETTEELERPKDGQDKFLQTKMDAWQDQMDALIRGALESGKNPRVRAMSVGRDWREGDGY